MRNSFVPDSLSLPPAPDTRIKRRVDTRAELGEPGDEALRDAVARARDALLSLQHPDAYWAFELEADCTIPAEYVLMMHFMDEIDEVLQGKIGVFLRNHQAAHGGWSLYPGGDIDVSCSVKAYYALKLAGDLPGAPHMERAHAAILAQGGAAKGNAFTRLTLAMFGQVPWRAVPMVPVEIMLLPRWFLFHLSKVSYWTRTVMVPLSILYSLRARARNPRGLGIAELFTTPPEQETNYFPARSALNRVLLHFEHLGKWLEPAVPAWIRRRALKRASAWFIERLNGTDGLGAIFPAMVNAHEALSVLGYASDHPYRMLTKVALQGLLVIREHSAYCQPCASVVWDTGLACHALFEAEERRATPELLRALDWLARRQLLDTPGDWQEYRRHLRGGGWPFQFGNGHYPDIDDTAMVAWAMHLIDAERYGESVERAAEWIAGMQSRNGGFGAFDADNTHYHLNQIPFADHGAMLDPPTSDVTGRCLALFGRLAPRFWQALADSLAFLRAEQEADGSWFGRWGTNYIYGTWSVLAGLELAAVSPGQPWVKRAVAWLKRMQRHDGGWGETNDTYLRPELAGQHDRSTAFHTAWAMLGLMAAGEVDSPEVALGAEYLMRARQPDGLWTDADFTAPGFPRVFYLKYHGYDKYFPLWALARYRNTRACPSR
jgi:squalene-hopene/tetraprenyl-beta-curcumene cyclase